MNLDLNLGPIDHSADDTETRSGSLPTEDINLEDWLDGSYRIREVVRRRQRWRSVLRQFQVPPETRNIALESMGASGLQTGEGSVTAEVRTTEAPKTCDNNDGFLEDGILGKKDDDEKANADAGSFFDCNICLELAHDPVVTCCGHLFCWPCLYRWLHVHSDAKECPVCKGEVTMKNVTPIYGRGKSARHVSEEDDWSARIPLRPQARRVESWRQAIQRTAFTIPMEEMIRRLNSRYDLSQVHPNDIDASRESPERSSSSLLNRILTSRGLRRELGNNVLLPDHVVDLTQSRPTNFVTGASRQMSSLLVHRSNSNRAASISPLASTLASAEIESFFRTGRNPEPHHVTVDDRDSMSSIAAVIHSESQTVDTAVEIDSTVALSTLSSRRRNDSSRISDVDSGDSRAPRRRRLN